MSNNSAIFSSDGVDFDQPNVDARDIHRKLSELTREQETLLNQYVHQSGTGVNPTVRPEGDGMYQEALSTLLEMDLLVQEGGSLFVPDSVKYHPEGPGVRRDQLSGVLHRLPVEAVRDWYRILGEPNLDSTEDWLVFRRLVKEIDRRREDLDSPVPPDWSDDCLRRDPTALDLDDELNIADFYSFLGESSTDYVPYFLTGILLPSWDENGLIQSIVFERSVRQDSMRGTPSVVEEPSGREVEWERKPFSPEEQLKFLLIASDAVPFRETREGEPHRFDLKEVARVSEWSTEHLEYLTFLLIENGFLKARDGRFFMNELAANWDEKSRSLNPFLSRFGTPQITHGEDSPGETPDLSAGYSLRLTLEIIVSVDGEVSAENLKNRLRNHPMLRSLLMVLPEKGTSATKRLERLVDGVLETLFAFGMTDRFVQDENVFYRPNDRGRSVLQSGELRGPEHEELPYILQPDGQLLVPLESPLRAFRRINPFTLLVKADRMLGYQIDRQSLVQALNDGWDATGFRTFLEEKTESVPEPLEDLFEETIGNVKDIDVRKVHHMIQFEDGGTTAKAANILNHYDPIRVDKNTLVLQSETSSETIRRNLSRGGIRLKGGNKDASMSPLLENEER